MSEPKTKPVEISAIQFDGTPAGALRVFETFDLPFGKVVPEGDLTKCSIKFKGPERGYEHATKGDWIVESAIGFTVLGPQSFEQLYRSTRLVTVVKYELKPKTDPPDPTSPLKTESSAAWLNFSASLKADPSWLWTYHCNLAMAIHDNAPQRSVPIGYCNMIAATFLNRAFNLRVTDPNGVDELDKFYHEAEVEHDHATCSICKRPPGPYRFCRHGLAKCAHCEGRADEEAMPHCKHGIMQLACLACSPHDFE